MNPSSRAILALAPKAARCWLCFWVVSTLLWSCGGREQEVAASGGSGSYAAGGTMTSSASSGAGGTGTSSFASGAGGTSSTLDAGGRTGIDPTEVTMWTPGDCQDGVCDPQLLFEAISLGAVGDMGVCDFPATAPVGKVNRLRGAVVLDSNGRVVDNTGLYGTEKQTWFDEVANSCWPCLADQTIYYSCSPGP